MTTVRIQLPDALAQEAEKEGLLASERVEKWLRDELKSRALGELTRISDRVSAVPDPARMTPEEVAEEIREMRAERRLNVEHTSSS
jgi:hypothetical protein